MERHGENEASLVPGTSSFNSLSAIYDADFDSTNTVKTHDNLEKCVAFIEGRIKSKSEKKKGSEEVESDVKLERQFLPEQMPVPARRRAPFRHVLTRMAECQAGPLSVLTQCAREGSRVKVWTRGPTSVRGVITGFLVAFDKHWNLALTDVDEQFTRRRARKVAVTGGTEPRTGAGAGEQREFKVGESVFRIIKVKRKVEICVRHSPQLLLRGEHVVMVSREMQDTQDSAATTGS